MDQPRIMKLVYHTVRCEARFESISRITLFSLPSRELSQSQIFFALPESSLRVR